MTNVDFGSYILRAVGDDPNGVTTSRVCRQLRATPQELGSAFELLLADGQLLGFAGLWISPTAFDIGTSRFMDALLLLHGVRPTLPFIPVDEVVEACELTWEGKPLDRIVAKLAADDRILVDPSGVRSTTTKLELSSRQRVLLTRVIGELESEVVNTPTPHQIAQLLGTPRQSVEEILKLGALAGEIVPLNDTVFYTPTQIETLKSMITVAAGGGPFSPTKLRDELHTSRKYIEPVLNYLELMGFIEGRAGEKVISSQSAF